MNKRKEYKLGLILHKGPRTRPGQNMTGTEQSSQITSSLKESTLFHMDLDKSVPATRNTEITEISTSLPACEQVQAIQRCSCCTSHTPETLGRP